MINTEQHTPAPSAAPDESFQARVQPWMMACFGAKISADRAERNHRLLEESLELVQACGCTASEARQLVDYVYGRPVGERAQEVGGVMVTLAALCLAQGLDMHAAGETELARIWTKVKVIRAKQAAKPKHSPLPVAAPNVAPDQQAAVVYPADGTISPFTVINLGHGQVKVGDAVHDGRLPALWFGKDGLGMGAVEEMNRAATEGETLAVVTFSNVEGLDVLAEVVQRIRSIAFPAAPVQAQEPEAAQQNGGLIRAALIDLLALERHALAGALTFEAQSDCGVRFARARQELSTPAQAVAVPDGWKLVPTEPTEAMMHAAQNVPAPRPYGAVYRAMLAAAPAASAAQDDAKDAGRLAIEEKAQEIYSTWQSQPEFVAWQHGGNSHMQERARDMARVAITTKATS